MRQIAVHWGANGKPEMCGHYYLSFDKVSQSPFTAVFLFYGFATLAFCYNTDDFPPSIVVLLALLAMNHLADNIEVSLQLLTNV